MEININEPGRFGVIKDMPAQEMPLNAWSDALNVRFVNNFVEKLEGHQAVYDPPSVAPYWLMPVPAGTNYFWLYAGTAKVFAVAGVSHSDITRVSGDYSATEDNVWTGGTLHGVGIVNNGFDDPQSWNPVSGSQKLVDLPNWPASTTCAALRPFKNFLVALDVVQANVRFPQLIKWSHPADPGLVPSTWNPADPTKFAGEYALSETGDFVIDCASLRDTNVVYKENSTWGMQPIGGVQVFRFHKIFGEIGVLSRNCVVEFSSGRHAVFGSDDIIHHDGQSAQSILTDRLRRWVYSRINGARYIRSFTALNLAKREVLFCYPAGSSDFCNEAVVWNFEKNTTSIRELPLISHMTLGVVDVNVGSTAWDTDTETWNQDTTTWGVITFNSASRGVLMAAPTVTKLYQLDSTQQFAGVDFTAYVERTGIGIPNRDVNMPPDITSRKLARRVWPRLVGTAGGIVKVSIGGQAHPDAPVVYAPEKDFVIGTTRFLDFLINAPLLAIKFRSATPIEWQLHGYTLDVAVLGKY